MQRRLLVLQEGKEVSGVSLVHESGGFAWAVGAARWDGSVRGRATLRRGEARRDVPTPSLVHFREQETEAAEWG